MTGAAHDGSHVPLGGGFYLERQRTFVRKTITLSVAIAALAPIIIWKSVLGAAIYLAFLAIVHVFALFVFLHRVPWRDLARHKWGLTMRIVGLITFGGLLSAIPLEAESVWFWPALTLLWLFHVLALALLHVRHHAEKRAIAAGETECPVPMPRDR